MLIAAVHQLLLFVCGVMLTSRVQRLCCYCHFEQFEVGIKQI
jgi:hypothetical protein